MLEQYQEQQIYIHVVENGSITKTAEMMGLSKARVSRALTKMEEVWQANLLIRNTRHIRVTDIGQKVYEHCLQIIESSNALREEVHNQQNHIEGVIRIATSETLTKHYLTHILQSFLQLYPDVTFELNMEGKHELLVENDYDIAVRVANLADSTLKSRRIDRTPLYVTAAPGYIAQYGMPQSVEDLKRHNCLIFSDIPQQYNWSKLLGLDDATKVTGNIEANSEAFLIEMATLGQGLLLFPEVIIRDQLASGLLMKVLETEVSHLDINLVYPFSRQLPQRVRLFIDFLVKHYQEEEA